MVTVKNKVNCGWKKIKMQIQVSYPESIHAGLKKKNLYMWWFIDEWRYSQYEEIFKQPDPVYNDN